MNTFNIIEKKANNQVLNRDELMYMVEGFVSNVVTDYQMSSFMMAIYCHGLNENELEYLTQAMIDSGSVCNLEGIDGICVDKHSTGGVGDKTSMILGPMLAASNLVFAKMSGRGLGHTGGTLDKLESIPGYQVELYEEAFITQLEDIKIAIIGQSKTMVVADKKMYALRDVTATIASIPLIASSIMSKKIASGADYILLDVKYGDGAFMETPQDAILLAETMIRIGTRFNRVVSAEISSMDQPLGNMIGNLLEVKECIQTLQGNGPKDLEDLCVHSAAKLLVMSKQESDILKAEDKVRKTLFNGSAFAKFKQLIRAQYGDYNKLEKELNILETITQTNVYATTSGYINKIQCKQLGLLSCFMKGGRMVKEDVIDVQVGIQMHCKLGAYVHAGDVLCCLYTNDINEGFIDLAKGCFLIDENKVEQSPIIYATIDE